MIDPPSADVTAHVVEALSHRGMADSLTVKRAVVWLLKAQEPDGSWFGRWGANHVYGTGAVVPALIAAGVRPGRPEIRNAVRWLVRHQRDDGGWGEDLRSYHDRSWIGHGVSTPSQTAWALLALLAAGERRPGPRTRRRMAGRSTSARTGPGTRTTSPAPASPATSTSTTTCTGWCSRYSALGPVPERVS